MSDDATAAAATGAPAEAAAGERAGARDAAAGAKYSRNSNISSTNDGGSDDDNDEDELLIMYRSLSVDELEAECHTLQLSAQGFLLLPRLLKEGVAASVKLGDARRLKSLLQAKADVNSRGNTDKPPVVWAAATSNLPALGLLIEAGANADSKAAFGVSALATAVRRNDGAVARRLIEEGAMVNAVAENGYTPLTWAAANGFCDLAEVLLEHEADPALGTVPAGLTPLHLAAQWGHEKVVQLLLETAMPPDTPDAKGTSALHLAAAKSHLPAIAVLLQMKSDINFANKTGNTALIQAAEFGHLDCCRRLLEAKANTRAKNTRNHGPLIRACANGHVGVAACLIAAKCNARAPSKHGIMTPLVWAARKGFREVVGLLLEAKADVETRPAADTGAYLPVWVGLDALNEAAKKGHTLVVKDLARSRERRLAARSRKLAKTEAGTDSFGF